MRTSGTQQAAIRRLQDTLIILGTGIIAFGVWTLIKTILLCTLGNDHLVHQTGQTSGKVSMIMLYAGLGFLTLVELGLRTYVGLQARAEGFGHKKGSIYLVVVVLMALMSTISIIATTASLIYFDTSPFDFVVTLAIEGTSLALLVLLIYSAIKLRQLSRTAE